MIPFLHLLLVVSEVYDPAICRTGHMHTQIAFNGVSCLNTTQKKLPFLFNFFLNPFFFPSLFSFFFFLPPLCNLFVCSIVCTIGQCSYDGALLLWCVSHKILTRTRIHNFCSFLSYPILKQYATALGKYTTFQEALDVCDHDLECGGVSYDGDFVPYSGGELVRGADTQVWVAEASGFFIFK